MAGHQTREATGRPNGFPTVDADAIGQTRHDAFRRYVEPEIEVLLRVAGTLTGSWVDAEDVVQDTLIRVWRAADRFDGAHPWAWRLTISSNQSVVRRSRAPG